MCHFAIAGEANGSRERVAAEKQGHCFMSTITTHMGSPTALLMGTCGTREKSHFRNDPVTKHPMGCFTLSQECQIHGSTPKHACFVLESPPKNKNRPQNGKGFRSISFKGGSAIVRPPLCLKIRDPPPKKNNNGKTTIKRACCSKTMSFWLSPKTGPDLDPCKGLTFSPAARENVLETA